jgi:Flp pilus assembly pilin Flp
VPGAGARDRAARCTPDRATAACSTGHLARAAAASAGDRGGGGEARALLSTAPMATEREGIVADEAGVVFVEYVVLVALVGIVVAVAIVLIGLPMLAQYQHMQAVLTSPVV